MRLRFALLAWVVPTVAVVGLAAPASASTAGTEHFLAVQTSATATTRPLFASGPITAVGTDKPVTNTKDIFKFPKGALLVDHHAVTRHNSFNPKLCLEQDTESGTYSVVGGTGAYQHASGSGQYQVRVIVAWPVPACNRHVPPKTFVLTIDAKGPLSF